MGQSYQDQQKKMELKGYTRLRTPKRCKQCRNMSYLHRKDGAMCFHCNESQNKTIKRVLVGVMGVVLLMFAGCQSAPSKVTVQANVAGQQLKVSVMR